MNADNTPMNPYAFVHTDWNLLPDRKTPGWYDHFSIGNLSGSRVKTELLNFNIL